MILLQKQFPSGCFPYSSSRSICICLWALLNFGEFTTNPTKSDIQQQIRNEPQLSFTYRRKIPSNPKSNRIKMWTEPTDSKHNTIESTFHYNAMQLHESSLTATPLRWMSVICHLIWNMAISNCFWIELLAKETTKNEILEWCMVML